MIWQNWCSPWLLKSHGLLLQDPKNLQQAKTKEKSNDICQKIAIIGLILSQSQLKGSLMKENPKLEKKMMKCHEVSNIVLGVQT